MSSDDQRVMVVDDEPDILTARDIPEKVGIQSQHVFFSPAGA